MNLIAVMAVIISSFATAYLIIRKEIRHCQELDKTLKLISLIRNNAIFYNAPFSDIIDNIHKNHSLDNATLFMRFSEEVSNGKQIPEAWKTAVKNSNLCLEMYECDTLIHFGEDMCCCNRDDISDIAEKAIYELQEFRKTAVENRNKKSKSTAAVAVSAGIMIILMFA